MTGPTEVVWIGARADYTAREVADLSGLPPDVVDALIECGALPVRDASGSIRFEAETVVVAQAAGRLRDHFELEWQGLAVAVSLIRRVRSLEGELALARATRTRVLD